MNETKNKTTSEIWALLSEYNVFFTKINKETYYNAAKSTKLIKDLTNKSNNDYYDIKRTLKIQIYAMRLALEDIEDEIKDFLERNNE